MIAHGLFADVEPSADLVVVEAFSNDFQDFSFARCEIVKKSQRPAVGRVYRQEIAERANELLPRRLRIQNETIATFQRHKARPRDERRDLATLIE